MFYFFKYGKKEYFGFDIKEFKKSSLFFSGILNIIFFHIFVYYDKNKLI